MRRLRIPWRVLIWGALLVALALRVVSLNDRGLWYDETFSILFASRSISEMIAGTLTPVGGAAADVHPLLYYVLLHGWLGLVGTSAFAARYISVLFGVATIPVAARIARDLFGSTVAVTTAIVLSVAPFGLAYSQEARMYAPLAFWVTLALLGFVRFRQSGDARWLLVLTLAGALALYSQNLGVLTFAALGVWAILDAVNRRDVRVLRGTVLAGAGMAFLWLPWLAQIPGQLGKIEQAYWVPPPTLVTLVQTVLVLSFDFDNAAPPAMLVPVLLFGALYILVVVATALGRALRQRRGGSQELGLVVALACIPPVLLFLVSQWLPMYVNRALLPAFVWYAMLFAWALQRTPRAVVALHAAVIGALVLVALPSYYSYARFPRSPFKQAAAALDRRVQPGDVVLHDNKLSFLPMYYYDPGLAEQFLPDPAGAGSDTLALPTQAALGIHATEFDAATAGAKRVWFVIFQDAIDQAAERGGAHPNLARMEQQWSQVSLDRYNDLNVYLFER